MLSNGKNQGALSAARPSSGDLVDRFLQARVFASLFGGAEEITLGRLRIEGTLGQGAMGAVLSAFDPLLDRHVAIKSLRPGREEDTDQLLGEARMLAKLEHNNIVSIYDVVEDAEGVYLVMEQVQGRDLRSWMSTERGWQEVVALFVELGKGLAAAHELEIAHCDVKPENVVVSEGRPRLIDFGLAHQRSLSASHGGTRAYLAPERLAGGPGSAAADQYAFFVSLVEAIEGKRPTEDGEHRWLKMPRWLQAVARRGLHVDPKQRYPNMQLALTALEPRVRRTRLILAAGVLVLASAAGGAGLLAMQSDSKANELCLGSEAQLRDVWSPETRAKMAAAFANSGVAKANEIWQQVDALLDNYAREWVDLRTQSCMATRVHEEQSEALLDFSMSCFDHRLLQLRSLSSLFADSATEAVVSSAKKSVGELGRLASCVDAQSLDRAVPLPESPEAREQLHALQEVFEQLKNLDRLGQYHEALVQSEALLAQAKELGYAPLSVEVLVLRAALQTTLSDLAAAEVTLREAASAAAAARDDKKVAEVWIRVVELLAQQSRFDEALTLEAVAVTSAERIPDDYEIQARLHNALGGIYLAKGRYQDAYAAYELALAMQRRIGTDGNPALASAIANFGLAKWYTGDFQGARDDLQEALAIMLQDVGPDHSRVAYIRQNIADLQMQLGQEKEAELEYQEVLRVWSLSLGPEHPNLAYPYEQLAMLAKGRGDFDTARAHIAEALRLREKALGSESALYLQGLTVEADILISQGSEESLQAADKSVARAMEIQDKLGEPGKRHAAFTLRAHAALAERRKDWQTALRDRQAMLALRIEMFGESHLDTGYSHTDLGRTYFQLGKLDEAERHFLEAQAIFDANPGMRDDDAVAMRQGRAEVLLQKGKKAEAIALFQEALERAEALKLERSEEIRLALANARDSK